MLNRIHALKDFVFHCTEMQSMVPTIQWQDLVNWIQNVKHSGSAKSMDLDTSAMT